MADAEKPKACDGTISTIDVDRSTSTDLSSHAEHELKSQSEEGVKTVSDVNDDILRSLMSVLSFSPSIAMSESTKQLSTLRIRLSSAEQTLQELEIKLDSLVDPAVLEGVRQSLKLESESIREFLQQCSMSADEANKADKFLHMMRGSNTFTETDLEYLGQPLVEKIVKLYHTSERSSKLAKSVEAFRKTSEAAIARDKEVRNEIAQVKADIAQMTQEIDELKTTVNDASLSAGRTSQYWSKLLGGLGVERTKEATQEPEI